MTADGSGDPSAVDGERALDALTLAWADEYDEIWFRDGAGWGAHHKDAPDDDVITGSTPDELNRKIRADWLRREAVRAELLIPLPTREPEHLDVPSAATMDDPHVLHRVHTGLKNL
jgi:hypothetical protein